MDALLFSAETVINMFAMMDLWLILYLLFGCDMKMSFRNIIIADIVFVIMFVSISAIFYGHNLIILGIVCLYNVLVTLVLCNGQRLRAVLLSVPAVLVYAQFGAFVDLFEILTGLDRFYISGSDGEGMSVAVMISDITLFVILILLSRTRVAKTKSIQLTAGEAIVVSAYCVFSPVVVMGLEWFEGQVSEPFYRFIWVLFMIIINVAVVYGIAYRKRAVYYRQLAEGYKKEFEAEYTHFRDYKQQQQDTIKFRHDWKNHMLLLQEMMEKEEYEKAEQYFRDLTETVSGSKQRIATGNELVDMILATKSGEMEALNIALQCKGSMEPIGFMKQVDCLILLSNLLDNAIEANAKVNGKRYISIKAKQTEGLFYLEIVNPMKGRLVRRGKSVLTTKEEKEYHGIGLSNVHDIVSSYEGKAQVDERQGEYSFKIVFPLTCG